MSHIKSLSDGCQGGKCLIPLLSFCLLGWARPRALSQRTPSLPALRTPRHFPRWVLEHPTTLEDSAQEATSITKVIPAPTPACNCIQASGKKSINHFYKENPSRDAGICYQLSIPGGQEWGAQRQQPGEGSRVFPKTAATVPDHPASLLALPAHLTQVLGQPRGLLPSLWRWPLFANSRGKF